MAKLAAGGIRQVNGSPIENTVALNRFCLDMNNRIKRSHGKTWSAVGMNIYAGGWDILIRRLQRHNTGWSLDNKAYDTSISRRLLEGVRDFRWNVVGPQIPKVQREAHRKAFFTLYEDLIDTTIITPLGEMIRKHKGNPSGSANTTTDNTLVLFVLLAFSWIKCAPTEFATYEFFIEEVEAALYGDDNTMTVSERSQIFFGPKTVAPAMALLGVTTAPSCMEAKPTTELDFLSNKTFKCGSFYVPVPVSYEKLLCSAAFRDKGNVAMRLSRACGLRQRGFFNPPAYVTLTEFCQFLVDKYQSIMADDPEWKTALSCILPSSSILAGYLPLMEAGCGAVLFDDGQTKDIMPANKGKQNRKPQHQVQQKQIRNTGGLSATAKRNMRRRFKKQNAQLNLTSASMTQSYTHVADGELLSLPLTAEMFKGEVPEGHVYRIVNIVLTLTQTDTVAAEDKQGIFKAFIGSEGKTVNFESRETLDCEWMNFCEPDTQITISTDPKFWVDAGQNHSVLTIATPRAGVYVRLRAQVLTRPKVAASVQSF